MELEVVIVTGIVWGWWLSWCWWLSWGCWLPLGDGCHGDAG